MNDYAESLKDLQRINRMLKTIDKLTHLLENVMELEERERTLNIAVVRAQKVLDDARSEAARVRTGADQYAQDIRHSLTDQVDKALAQARADADAIRKP